MQPKQLLPAMFLAVLALLSDFSYAQPGSLNSSFGENGFLNQRFRSNSNAFNELASGIINLADGKSIVALQVASSTILTRITSTGAIDTTFATKGYSEYVRLGKSYIALAEDKSVYLAGLFSRGYGLAHFNSNGSLDKRFGVNGVVSISINDRNANVQSLLIQPDGKLVVAGLINNGTNYDIFVTRHNSDGSLDVSFGNGGKVTTDFGYSDYGYAAALQPDGKILVSGGIVTPNDFNNISTVRYNVNGSLDSSFGNKGVVISIQNVSQAANAVKVLPDGRILVAGGNRDFIVLCYRPDGLPDLTFGINGMVTTHFTSAPENARSMEIQGDGKIVVAGDLSDISNKTVTGLARYYPNGKLDESFGVGGKAVVAFGPLNSRIEALCLQPNGKIMATGFVQTTGGALTDYAILQCEPNGAPDKSFGIGGQVTGFVDGELSEFRSIAVQRDQKIVVSGFSNTANDADFVLARYHLDGTLDNSFGVNGKVVNNFGLYDAANAMLILPDGKILAAGNIRTVTSNSDIILARYNSDGSLDASFGQGGKVVTGINSNSENLTSISIQQDNRILAGGSTSSTTGQSALLIRYHPDGVLDDSFANNGMLITKMGYAGAFIVSVKVLQSGKILTLVRGIGANNNMDIVLAQYNSNGTPDVSFGKNGIVITDFTASDVGQCMEVQADGKITIGGSIGVSSPDADFALIRYNADGSLDQTFGNGGKVVTDLGAGDMGQALSIQPGGNITLVGYSISDNESALWLTRYKADGTLDSSFGQHGKVITDLDGDPLFFKSAIIGNNLYTAGTLRRLSSYASIASYVLRLPVRLSCPQDVVVRTGAGSCSAVVPNIDPIVTPSDSDEKVNFTLKGATTGLGSGSASGHAFNKGVTTVTYSLVEDPDSTGSFTVTVQDTEAPEISNLAVNTNTLWPPDNQMKDVIVSYNSKDNCGQPVSAISVTSNEQTGGTGNNETDWEIVDGHLVRLRAERDGKGDGRVYSIKVTATDEAGNATTETITVRVPKSELNIKVSSNPTTTHFTLQFNGVNMDDKATLRVMNSMGKIIEMRHNITPGQSIQIGSDYNPGLYFIELIQGSYKEQVKVIKQ